ncbi:MAG TPA: response regulator [Gammaproteobacteria bacterium]|nr:response regulator [Gammaproteobacteria bacterium]
MNRLMLVDDEENILKALQRAFRSQKDWEVEIYSDPNAALRRAQTANFDLFLSDYRMPEMNGVQFLTEVKSLQPEAMRLILSGHTDLQALLGAINQAEIYRFVTKPWGDYEIIIVLQQALKYRDMLLENHYLANQVREQEQELKRQKSMLERLKETNPELFNVNWASDGSIILDDDDLT